MLLKNINKLLINIAVINIPKMFGNYKYYDFKHFKGAWICYFMEKIQNFINMTFQNLQSGGMKTNGKQLLNDRLFTQRNWYEI